MGYFEILLGSGFYWLNQYIVEAESEQHAWDILCDWMEDNNDGHLIDMNEWQWKGDDLVSKDWVLKPDEFMVGGNHSVAIHHHGELQIKEITEDEYINLISDGGAIEVKGEAYA